MLTTVLRPAAAVVAVRLRQRAKHAKHPPPARSSGPKPMAAMLPEFQNVLERYMCPSSPLECAVAGAAADEASQWQVLQAFADLSRGFDVSHGQEYVLRALLAGDLWTAKELAVGFDLYNAALTVIHTALERLPPEAVVSLPGV